MKPKTTLKITLVGLVLAVLVSAAVLAWNSPNQPRFALAAPNALQLNWWTADAGGGTSAGTTFSLSGTIGQPEAGPPGAGMTGGAYHLEGGFWPGVTSNRSLYLPLLKN